MPFKLFLKVTHVGRYGINFLYTSFGFEIYPTCYQHKDDLVPKFSLCINKNSILGRVLKLEVVMSFPICFSQQHMLVDLEYVFLCGSFGFGISHTCSQRGGGFMSKISWANDFF